MRINDKYSSNYSKYESTHPFAVRTMSRFLHTVSSLILELKCGFILNAGCGQSLDFYHLSKIKEFEFDVCVGVDVNIHALYLAKIITKNMNCYYINGDIYQLPLNLGKFQLFLCLEVLEHLRWPELLLEDISNRFKGSCIFSVPNEPLYRLTRMLLLRKDLRRFGNQPEHLQNWSSMGFRRLLGRYFTIDRVLRPFPWTVVLCHSGAN